MEKTNRVSRFQKGAVSVLVALTLPVLVGAGAFATRKIPHGPGDITPDVRACGCVALAGARCVPGGVV